MPWPARRNIKAETVEEAVRATQQGMAASPAAFGVSGEAGAASSSAGGSLSIQDGQGRLRWIWGISEWREGGDVFADG